MTIDSFGGARSQTQFSFFFLVSSVFFLRKTQILDTFKNLIPEVKWKSMRSNILAIIRRRTGTKPIPSFGHYVHKYRQFTSSSFDVESVPQILYDTVPKDDFGDFKEYSVIFTNRSLNLMSDPFQQVMRDLNTLLRKTYNARKVAIIPG